MAYKGIIKKDLIKAIKNTEIKWSDITFKKQGALNEVCPLCLYIRNETKTSFDKGMPRGSCLLCPVLFFGHFHICAAIRDKYWDKAWFEHEAAKREFSNVKKAVISKLKALQKSLEDKEKFEWYISFVDIEKAGGQKSTVTKPEQPLPKQKPRIIRRRKQ